MTVLSCLTCPVTPAGLIVRELPGILRGELHLEMSVISTSLVPAS